ncbi:MAG: VWA domain-containing protein [Candidatus Hydrogenedentes bacterium]|nr:VWA domain-containing protein [Candidatus Hydrogenedentota bacterium]
MGRMNFGGRLRLVAAVALVVAGAGNLVSANAQLPPSTNLDSFAIKIFRVESGLYPFVQVYFRTFNQDMRPLVNLNERNMGVMVNGRSYDMAKMQFVVQTISHREEAIRSVLVIDCSKTMAGTPFEEALTAAARYIDSKRPQDQVAVLAVNDASEGYEVISNFERDPEALGRRLADVKCDANTTRLYDAIGAAMQMCGMVSQGGVSTGDAEYIVSNSIVVFSDGKDEGSALQREDLMTRISNLSVPIPIYSLAYSRVDASHLRNLEALSKNSFGIYYPLGEAIDRMQRCVEDVQNILQNDYVLVFRSYQEVDGDKHPVKIGLEYPTGSGKMTYQSAEFEAVEPPPMDKVLEAQNQFAERLKPLPDGNPYLSNPHVAGQEGQG